MINFGLVVLIIVFSYSKLYLYICICKSICTSVVETAGESFCWAGQRATNKKWPSLVTKDIVFVFFVFVFVLVFFSIRIREPQTRSDQGHILLGVCNFCLSFSFQHYLYLSLNIHVCVFVIVFIFVLVFVSICIFICALSLFSDNKFHILLLITSKQHAVFFQSVSFSFPLVFPRLFFS